MPRGRQCQKARTRRTYGRRDQFLPGLIGASRWLSTWPRHNLFLPAGLEGKEALMGCTRRKTGPTGTLPLPTEDYTHTSARVLRCYAAGEEMDTILHRVFVNRNITTCCFFVPTWSLTKTPDNKISAKNWPLLL